MPPPPTGNPPARRKATGTGAVAASKPGTARRPAAQPRGGAKLVCTAGPASGQEFSLEGDEVVIGRASDNPVSIPDTSVSRKHALLRRSEGGWAVSDLGSGNGTMVNGEAIADETALGDGDTIALGDSEFRYQDPAAGASALAPSPAAGGRRPPVRTSRMGGAPERSAGRGRPLRGAKPELDPAEQKARRKKLFIRIGGAAVVLLALLVGWKAIDNKRTRERIEKQRILRAQQEEMAALFQEAKNLVRQGKWSDARAKLQELQETDPDYFEANNVGNYVSIAEREIPNEKAMLEATKALTDKRAGAAATALAKVKDTTQSRQLEQLKIQLNDLVSEKFGDARMLLPMTSDLAKMEALQAIAEDILVARPEDRDATEFKKTAEQAIFRIKNPKQAPVEPDRPWLAVQSLFRSGDKTGAQSLAQACANKHKECRTLEGQIKDFDAKMKNLESLGEGELNTLYALDKKISGGESSEMAKPIKVRVAAQNYMAASKAKTTRDWPRAIDFAKKVLQADPNHAGAQSIVQEARSQAKDIYLRGYQLKDTDSDAAAKLFKEVMAITPKDDEYHQKAQARLSELQRQ